jgi:selenide, water dikinase
LLDSVLKRLPQPNDPNLLVGFDTSDDAGVYRLTDDIALVQTVDFLTPIADDPFIYGQIAAANSLSDVYAMGGKPVSALTILGFPASGTPDLLDQILRGGLNKMNEANCTVAGGHSIRDDDLKFGYAVTGIIHPRLIWRNVGALPGDKLFLTKPLGTGVIATALKQGKADAAWVAASVEFMVRLNRDAADALREIEGRSTGDTPIHAVTDVTGFGLLGHAREMAIGSGVSLRIDPARIEYLPGALDAARGGFLSGGLANNRQFLEGCVEFAAHVHDDYRSLLLDPQTSGGLLAAIAGEISQEALGLLKSRGVSARLIGEVVSKRAPLIEVS